MSANGWKKGWKVCRILPKNDKERLVSAWDHWVDLRDMFNLHGWPNQEETEKAIRRFLARSRTDAD